MSLTPLEEMSDRIQGLRERVPDLELVVLFGSTVKGRRRVGSDVDVAVRCTGLADLDVLHRLLAPALGSDRLDLVDLRHASPILAMEVARSGRLLYESRPGTFRQFQSLTSRRYCDTEKLRRAQRREVHVFLERHGLALCEQSPARSSVGAAIVRRKLGRIMTSLELLTPTRGVNSDECRRSVWARKGTKRVLQEAIGAALSINAHLIAEQGHDVPVDYFGGFVKLGQLDILSEEMAAALALSAGLRHRLVREGEALDDTKVLAAVGTLLDLYPLYIQAVEARLVKLES